MIDMPITTFLFLSLATWRISSLLVREDGPFFLFRKLREFVGIGHDQEGEVFSIPETFWGELLSCVWCCSVWVAAGWFLLWLFFPEIAIICAMPLAISGVAIFFDEQMKG